MTIHTKLTNYGKRTIDAQEYNHNFLSLNGELISPDYTMSVPGFENLEGGKFLGNNIYGDDKEHCLRLHRLPTEPYMTFLDTVKEDFDSYTYRLTSKNSTHSITEQDDFKPVRAVVWGVEHCMCCEVFVQVHVEPGQSQEWTRTWTFEN